MSEFILQIEKLFSAFSDPEYRYLLLEPLIFYGILIGVGMLITGFFMKAPKLQMAALIVVGITAFSHIPYKEARLAAQPRMEQVYKISSPSRVRSFNETTKGWIATSWKFRLLIIVTGIAILFGVNRKPFWHGSRHRNGATGSSRSERCHLVSLPGCHCLPSQSKTARRADRSKDPSSETNASTCAGSAKAYRTRVALDAASFCSRSELRRQNRPLEHSASTSSNRTKEAPDQATSVERIYCDKSALYSSTTLPSMSHSCIVTTWVAQSICSRPKFRLWKLVGLTR